MKKMLIAALMAATMVLAACGSTAETTAPAQDAAVEEKAEEKAEEAAEETADAAVEESAAEETDADENASDDKNAGNDASATDKASVSETDSFIFEYDGIQMGVNMEAAPVLEALGEPVSYFEAASCAFEGLDKMYTYSSFEVDTYPEGDVDYISCIYFLDDLVETPEGICLYMTQADMEEAYGTEYTEVNGAFVYSKGNGELSFIIENDEIVAIEYKTKVDYD